MESQKIYKYFEAATERMVGLIREIVDIESPSRDAARSGKIADWVEDRFGSLGKDVAIDRLPVEDGQHMLITVFPGDEKPALLLGHTDTVHPVGSKSANPTRIEGDLIYGCGIFDMKANIVVALEALRSFAETGSRPARPIKILLSCDEEIGSHTGRAIVESEAAGAEYCLVLEPSAEGRVKTGRKGTAMYTLCARGLPAHAGLEPDKGANAIAELARQIPAVHAIADREAGTNVNVTTIKGGTTTNVIPEFAECDIDVRFQTAAEAKRVEAALRALAPTDWRVSLELKGGINRPPMERTAEVIALFEKARDLGATFGYGLDETQVGGASDGNFVAALGVPLIDGLGIRGDGAHMLTEHIRISDIAPRAALVTLLLKNL